MSKGTLSHRGRILLLGLAAVAFGSTMIVGIAAGEPAPLAATSVKTDAGETGSSSAAALAAEEGISEVEAERILAEQVAFGELTAILRKTFPGEFADAWAERLSRVS